MVKRFLQARGGQQGRANRFQPLAEMPDPQFELLSKKAIGPDAAELAENPRARSAKLRVARRTEAAPGEIDAKSIAMPHLREDR